jgi:quinol monooxygenase YgiN
VHIVIATARVRPDKIALYEQTFRDLKAKVDALEPGVLFYELCKDPKEANTYRLIEAYSDEAVQQAHIDTDYYRAASRVIVECLAGDHHAEIARRGLTNPADIYPLITTLQMEWMQPI